MPRELMPLTLLIIEKQGTTRNKDYYKGMLQDIDRNHFEKEESECRMMKLLFCCLILLLQVSLSKTYLLRSGPAFTTRRFATTLIQENQVQVTKAKQSETSKSTNKNVLIFPSALVACYSLWELKTTVSSLPSTLTATTALAPAFKGLSLISLAYLPCLVWGLPWSKIGSWRSVKSIGHRFGGIFTLLLPLLFAVWESITSTHISTPLYLLGIGMILLNIYMGAALIPSRIPAYDIPTLRAFAVGVLLALSFASLSLFFRFGHLASYAIIGKVLAAVTIYGVVYAWSDALQHLNNFRKKEFKEEIGKKWYLPFQKSSFKHVFLDCLIKQPTKEGLAASVSPANHVTVLTTFLTAIFASTALIQCRYLLSGTDGVQKLMELYPDIARWSTYNALLAVVANNFGTFVGTLVVQNKIPQQIGGMFNAIGLFIPVFNVIAFTMKYPLLWKGLFVTSFGKL